MEQRFLLQESGGKRRVEAWGFPVQLRGDPALCERITAYLQDSVLVLAQSLDPESGERGTRVVSLEPGGSGWLLSCLRRAADELDLQLSEAPLSAS